MQALAPEYAQRIEEIKTAIQESELLSEYLETEDSELYNAFKEAFEPDIAAIYEEAATYYPLQLEALELALLDPGLEGLYMAKLLGYAVLRPRVNEKTGQYYRAQDHLREVMLAIGSSNAFAELQKRVGQGVTVAFALSTHVWATSLIGDVASRGPRQFFQQHHDDAVHTAEQRMTLYRRYERQFVNDNYAAAAFPTTAQEMSSDFPSLERFLRFRVGRELDNESLVGPILEVLANAEMAQLPEFERFLALVGMFIDVPEEYENGLRTQIREFAARPDFAQHYFSFLAELHHAEEIDITADVDRRMAMRVGTTGQGLMQEYYALVLKIHDAGIGHLEAQDAIRLFVREQEGLSDVNECVRQTVLRYLKQLLTGLDVESYSEFFEMTKLFGVHFEIFDNESFKQDVRQHSLHYVKQLLKRYTDKRGKDYQDIKKFVRTTFVDLGFMDEKDVVNLFKTKRTRRPSAA